MTRSEGRKDRKRKLEWGGRGGMLHGRQDPSSPTRDRTVLPAMEA